VEDAPRLLDRLFQTNWREPQELRSGRPAWSGPL